MQGQEAVTISLVDLVNAGFLGFAVVIMYFASNLLKDLVSSEKPGSQAVVKEKTKTIVIYLVLSSFVVSLGILYMLLRVPEQLSFKVSVYPSRHADLISRVELRTEEGVPIRLDGTMVAEVTIRQGEGLDLVLEDFT